MTSPRWWEPRFAGSVTRERLPPAIFEGLVEQAKATGLRVVDEPTPEACPSYRAPASPRRSLQLEQREAFVGAWDRLHVWQDGGGRIRFEGSFRRWANHLRLVWLAFAALYGGMLTLCCPSVLAAGVGLALALTFLPLQWVHRLRTTKWVEHLVEDQVKRAEEACASEQPASSGERPPRAAPARIAAPVRVRPADRVLATAARTAHDDVWHAEASPEDLVEAIESRGRRG